MSGGGGKGGDQGQRMIVSTPSEGEQEKHRLGQKLGRDRVPLRLGIEAGLGSFFDGLEESVAVGREPMDAEAKQAHQDATLAAADAKRARKAAKRRKP